ncbi:MAG: YicC/YloC family endoribonuclease [Gammaproteobacteria bacterium]
MINSMTGFARRDCHHETGHYSWELRTVNHRFLELGFRLPENFRELETELRELAKASLARGKFDAVLHFSPSESTHPEITLHRGLLKQLMVVHSEVTALLPNTAPIDSISVMRWPGVLAIGDVDLKVIKPYILQMFSETLTALTEERKREGYSIQDIINQRLNIMQDYVKQLETRIPQCIQQQRSKLLTRIKQLDVEMDMERIEQEVVLLAQRADVAEEIDRLATHIVEMQMTLSQGGVVGRRLDFLLQEMLREANTLGSKSTDMQMTHITVELKVLIEQIREQIQNIE